MAEIMVALAGQLQTYFEAANLKAEERYRELRDALLKEFADEASQAKPEAFADPDYQKVVRDAHESFARNGDDQLKEELVRLLTERSIQETGSRKALVLNEAIQTAGSLTPEEYAAIAIIFLYKYTKISGSPRGIIARLHEMTSVFLHDLPSDDWSYDYLVSMRCASMNQFGGSSLWEVLHEIYASDLSFGFSPEELKKAVGENAADQRALNFTVPAAAHFGGHIRFDAKDAEALKAKLDAAGVGEEAKQRLVQLFEQSRPSQEALREQFQADYSTFETLAEKWQKTALKLATLTGLGKALAHSALTSRAGFNAALEIWVR
jgi:hypothetical protein